MIGAAYIGSQRANSRILLATTLFTEATSSNYTIPSGAVYIEVDMYGGGGFGGVGQYSAGGRGGVAFIAGGGGGGGGSRVKHRYSSNLASGDLIYFNIGNGGININSAVGGGTVLSSHLRGATNIYTFSPAPTAAGGGGGTTGGAGGSGGVASNGNLSNQNGSAGVAAANSATVAQNGGDGGNPASGGGTTKGLGGLQATNTPPTAGTQPGGGGGGGYAKVNASYSGAIGGKGQLEIKVYG